MARYRVVLLDVDGTLVDSNDLHAQAWQEALADGGMQVPFERVRSLIGMGGDKVGPELTGLSSDDASVKALTKARERLFLHKYLPLVEPFPGVRELLERLLRDGHRLVVASSAGREELEGLLQRSGVADLLTEATSSGDASHSKPDPDIVQAALAKARVAAHEAIMLGDTPYDVEAAQRAKVAIIGLRCGGWDTASLHGCAAVFQDPADLLRHYPKYFEADRPAAGQERPATR
jgi:HAD superfamily hydrolase (TIGR01509 family)